MRFIFILLLLVLFSVGAFAESQQQKTAKKTKNSEYNSNEIQRGTEQSPFVVKTLQAQNSKEETERNAEDKKGEKEDRRNLNLLTLCLAVIGTFQLVVFAYQAVCLRNTIKATEKAAKAAQDSADALSKIEKAYIFISVEFKHFDIFIKLTNHGKTPAILTKAHGSWVSQKTCPSKIDRRINADIPDGIVISGSKPYSIRIPPAIDAMDCRAFKDSGDILFCYGLVEYKDVLGNSRETGFCWQHVTDIEGSRFNIADSKLNYYT
jgi:hypothetical protein